MHCCVHSLRSRGVSARGVNRILPMGRGSGMVGVLATNRLAELLMQTQARLPHRPCTFPSLHSDFVMTISGETPILCLLGKNKFEHFMVVDRTLSWNMLIQIFKVFNVYTKGYALQVCGAQRVVRSGALGAVCCYGDTVHSETIWDLTENMSIMGHTTSVVRYLFFIVIVIYFQLFF